MSACDHCLSSCSDDGHSLGDEGYDPTRECFCIDQEDHNGDNHLGMQGGDGAGNFEPAEAVKSVSLDPGNYASKKIRIVSKLDPK
jgi:hypothetical protein